MTCLTEGELRDLENYNRQYKGLLENDAARILAEIRAVRASRVHMLGLLIDISRLLREFMEDQ